MSSIFVQIGQCGCQIGYKLNKKLSNSYYCTRIQPPNKIHSIMIDTQPKVIKPFIENPPKWLDLDNAKYFQYGRGNNWSYGYMHQLPTHFEQKSFIQGHKQFSHLAKNQKRRRQIKQYQQISIQTPNMASKNTSPMKKKSIDKKLSDQNNIFQGKNNKQARYSQQKNQQSDLNNLLTDFQEKVLVNKYLKQNKQICEYTLEKIRKQLDTCDCPSAINVLCSLGGGTGSGLGTKIIQKIHQQFNMDLFAHVVLPNKSGETPLQIYNCCLSLASIQQHSSAIFTYENDNMIKSFLKMSPDLAGFKGTDLDFVNEQISDMQAILFGINQLDNLGLFYSHIVSENVISNQMKYLTLFGSRASSSNNIGQSFQLAFQKICNQLRVYNQDDYFVEGVASRRQKCLSHSMIVMSSQQISMQDHQRKKLKNMINPISYNSQLAIQFCSLNKKNINANNLNISKSGKQSGQVGHTHHNCQMSLVMNHSNILRYLQYLSVNGRKKYQAKAYLWHYKYAQLESAFDRIQSVIDQYYYASTD